MSAPIRNTLRDRALAAEIVRRLFTNGQGQEALRIVLELPGKVDGGGYCWQSALDQVLIALREAQSR
jgi:hypothetical protein